MEQIIDKIANSVNDYIHKCNVSSLVLAVSGGLDTAIAAYICNKVTKINTNVKFISVYMPSDVNSEEQYEYAKIIGSLSDNFISYNVQDNFDILSNSFLSNGSLQTEIQKGNIKARLRMMFLYDVALQNKGIVIDSNNKTERYLGFFSLHGNVGDIAPLSDLWKTDIYKIAEYLMNIETNDSLKNILYTHIQDKNKHVIDSDSNDSFQGLTFIDIDIILKRVINARYMILNTNVESFLKTDYMSDICEKYGDKNISMIIRRYFNSHYKRKQLPVKINIFQ